MKKLVNLVVIAIILAMTLFICTNSFAKTVIITTDGLNLRREASKSADVLEIISKDEEVELIEELAEWYKVKYAGMTGYISKDYAKIKGEETTTAENNNVTNSNINNTVTNSSTTNDNSITNVVTNNNTSEPNVPTTTPITEPVTTTVSTSKQMKIIENTKGYILPLINSNIIQEFKQNEVVTVLSFVNGWAYIESSVANSWVRTDKLVDSDSNSNGATQPTSNPIATETIQKPTNNEGQEPTNSNPQNPDNNDTQQPTVNGGEAQITTPSNNGKINVTPIERRVMYVQEPSVYVRSGPATTYDEVDSVVLNNTVIVTGEAGDWYQVEVDGKTGYIASWLLGKTAKETTSRGNIQRNQTTESTIQTTSSQVTSKGEQVVEYAKQYLGCKYVYGGSGPNTFDCSGFTMYVYKNFGVSLSHSATAQSNRGTYVAKEDLQPGDLVFFKDYQTMDGIGHCGIYIGGGEFIHASSGTGYCVKVSTLLSGSYEKRYETARRIF